MIRPSIQAALFGLSYFCLSPSFAIQPVDGYYAGIFLGPTATNDVKFSFNPSQIPTSTINSFKSSLEQLFNISLDQVNLLLPNTTVNGTLKYGVLGGIGLNVGYRLCTRFRFEAETLYNNNPFDSLQLGDYTIDAANSGSTLYIKGSTTTLAEMFNFIFDFPITAKDNDGYSQIMPYLGVGVGYTYAFSELEFHYGADNSDPDNPTTLYQTNLSRSRSALGYQGIAGVSYFMDDFCWLSFDIRFFGTSATTIFQPNTGATFRDQTQLFSVMLGFHGALGNG